MGRIAFSHCAMILRALMAASPSHHVRPVESADLELTVTRFVQQESLLENDVAETRTNLFVFRVVRLHDPRTSPPFRRDC